MKPLKPFTTPLFLILLIATTSFASPVQEIITMTLPEWVIQEAISKSLPLDFKLQSDTLLGSVSIDKIQGLQLQQNKLSSHITLSGHKLNVVTNIAGHDLRMKIGSLTMDFQCDATIRFDTQKQTLYIKPIITEVQSTNTQNTEVASALALLFNNREFPLPFEKLRPIVADAGSKLLSISMIISNIKIQPENLQLSLFPRIETTSK
ncbi:MAG: hypothetical protein K9K37_01595 [Desulfocapsa sp.]|nr:hypothetical protein [Desulfocapsa sp.]